MVLYKTIDFSSADTVTINLTSLSQEKSIDSLERDLGTLCIYVFTPTGSSPIELTISKYAKIQTDMGIETKKFAEETLTPVADEAVGMDLIVFPLIDTLVINCAGSGSGVGYITVRSI